MLGFCPSCAKDTRLTRLPKTETILVKGEGILVEVDRFQCLECGSEFASPAIDIQAVAYREYRRRRGMIQPEEIRVLRSKYDLSQRELSALLGFGGATLSRYENGSLQDEAHDTILRLIQRPDNLLQIVEGDRTVLESGKREKLIACLREEVARVELIRLIDRRGRYDAPNSYNGQTKIQLNRLLTVVKTLCHRKGVYKAKLNKLLFYADFKHYQQYGQGITGLCYAHLPYGPAPDQYEVILQRLLDLDSDLAVEEDPTQECGGEIYRCEQEPDRIVLTFSELQTLIEVDGFFKTYTSTMIANFSHEEYGYQRTQTGELISYEYAARLRI